MGNNAATKAIMALVLGMGLAVYNASRTELSLQEEMDKEGVKAETTENFIKDLEKQAEENNEVLQDAQFQEQFRKKAVTEATSFNAITGHEAAGAEMTDINSKSTEEEEEKGAADVDERAHTHTHTGEVCCCPGENSAWYKKTGVTLPTHGTDGFYETCCHFYPKCLSENSPYNTPMPEKKEVCQNKKTKEGDEDAKEKLADEKADAACKSMKEGEGDRQAKEKAYFDCKMKYWIDHED